MRCNNCGWDNPDKNTKCEKCNAPLDDTVMESNATSYNFAGAIAADTPPYEFNAGRVEEKKSFSFSSGKFTPQSTAVGIAPDDFFPQSAADTPTDDYLSLSAAQTGLSDDYYSMTPVDGYWSERPAPAPVYDDMLEVIVPEAISNVSPPMEPAPKPVFLDNPPAEPAPKPDARHEKPQEPAVRAIINVGVAPPPNATTVQCSECGYPVRPGESECAMCGASVSKAKEEPVVQPAPPEVFKSSTFIQVTGVPKKEMAGQDRRKLIGFLITYSNSPNGDFFPIYEGKNFIGRGASCHATIQGDSSVSEKHMSILYRAVDRKIKFKDEQSSNGTYVNDKLLDEGELKNFDKIRIGATQLLFMEIPFSKFE